MKKTISIIVIGLFFGCKNEAINSFDTELAFSPPTYEIDPPVEEDIPEKELYSINTAKDTILVSDRGSLINIPANSFVDNTGKIVHDVDVEFTEFSNPADIVFSGIPMEYKDESGIKTFQSAGMCEIEASADGNPVSIAKGKSIDIALRNKAKDSDYNLYFFDRQKGEWIEKETNLEVKNMPLPLKPIIVENVDSNSIVHVEVDESQINEDLQIWDQSKFYLLPGQTPKCKDIDIFWYKVNVVKTDDPDIYVLKFNGTKHGKQVVDVLKVKPIVDPDKYEDALKIFDEKMRKQASMIFQDNEIFKGKPKSADQTIEEIYEQHDYMVEMLEKQHIRDSIRIVNQEAAVEVNKDVMRTFEVNQLGIYNCDRFYARPILVTREFKFLDKGELLEFNYTSLCSPADNAVLPINFVSDATYKIDLSTGIFYFIGIKGKDIYCKKLNSQIPNGTYTIDKISKKELEMLMI